MALTVSNAQALVAERAEVLAVGGDHLGTIADVFFDTGTGVPNWALIETADGSAARLVPLTGAEIVSTGLQLPLDRSVISASPKVSRSGPPDPATEQSLRGHYRLDQPDEPHPDGPGAAAETADGDAAMILSEERLQTSTQVRPSSRVKISKRIVTEQVTQTVPVRREELRIERLPIETDSAGKPEDHSSAEVDHQLEEGEYEIVLYEERIVLTRIVVPIERVRLNTHTVSEEVTVTEDLRKEQVELSERQT